MTKDQYYEMCNVIGTDPVDSDIPIEFEDLPNFIQNTFNIYTFLGDRWEGMSATFMGKDYSIVFNLFEIFEVENIAEKQLMLRIMSIIDKIRSNIITKKYKQHEIKKPST